MMMCFGFEWLVVFVIMMVVISFAQTMMTLSLSGSNEDDDDDDGGGAVSDANHDDGDDVSDSIDDDGCGGGCLTEWMMTMMCLTRMMIRMMVTMTKLLLGCRGGGCYGRQGHRGAAPVPTGSPFRSGKRAWGGEGRGFHFGQCRVQFRVGVTLNI